jgi:hypothetical protein
MMRFHLSNSAWKALILVLAILAASFVLVELSYSFRPYEEGQRGTLGARFDTANTNKLHTIEELSADSPLKAIGAAVGDKVKLDSVDVFSRHFLHVGELVGLTVTNSTTSRHAVVTAISEPLSPSVYFGSISDMLISALAAAFAVLIAFKQPESRTYRALALYFVFHAFNCNFKFAPPGVLHLITDVSSFGTQNLIVYCGALFAIYYPADKPEGIRGILARFVPALSMVTLAAVFFAIWCIADPAAPAIDPVAPLYGGIGTVVMLTALLDGWRASTGEERQRYGWLITAIGTSTFFSTLSNVPIFSAGGPNTAAFFVVKDLEFLSLLMMEIGIAYAVLKHRVFNFGFAVNRAIFYSATTLLLLVTFGIVEWGSEHFLHFEGREANVFVDGSIALAVYLTFHRIRHIFEHWLERVFFHKWHANEAKLRQFVNQAAHITAANALLGELRVELKRFSGGAACVVYLMDSEGGYMATGNSDSSNADRININDRISIALRSEHAPMRIRDEHPTHAHELALPMSHRGELHGFVLLSEKPNGEEYRPDEVDVLAFAVHQIGLDLYALQNELLKTEVEASARKIESLQNKNEVLQDVVSRISDKLEQLRA